MMSRQKNGKAVSATLASVAFLLGNLSYGAGVPRASVTAFPLQLHALYVSSDATCATGLQAILPMSATATTVDFAAGGKIGGATITGAINCVVIIMKSDIAATVAAGSYDNTACDAGGSVDADYQIGTGQTAEYPTKVQEDATAAGVTLFTGPGPSTSNSIVPIYLSTNSKCTTDTLPAGAGCAAYPNGYKLPNTSTSSPQGFLMAAATAGSAFKFVFDVDGIIEDDNGSTAGGTCSVVAPPLMGFAAR